MTRVEYDYTSVALDLLRRAVGFDGLNSHDHDLATAFLSEEEPECTDAAHGMCMYVRKLAVARRAERIARSSRTGGAGTGGRP